MLIGVQLVQLTSEGLLLLTLRSDDQPAHLVGNTHLRFSGAVCTTHLTSA
jgi:hypothetical protein